MNMSNINNFITELSHACESAPNDWKGIQSAKHEDKVVFQHDLKAYRRGRVTNQLFFFISHVVVSFENRSLYHR